MGEIQRGYIWNNNQWILFYVVGEHFYYRFGREVLQWAAGFSTFSNWSRIPLSEWSFTGESFYFKD